MIFELAEDYTSALEALPTNYPRRELLELYDEALRRDIRFVYHHRADYPIALFQCMWNVASWLSEYTDDDSALGTLVDHLHAWRRLKERQTPGMHWVRSLRPPVERLGGYQHMVMRGHENSVYCVAFSSDSRYLVGASSDRTIRIWSLRTGKEIRNTRTENNWIFPIALSADDKLLAYPQNDDNIAIVDFTSGEVVRQVQLPLGRIWDLAFAPNRRYLVSAHDEHLCVLDVKLGDRLWTRRAENVVGAIAYSHDGTRIASASNGLVQLWDADEGNLLATWEGHEPSAIHRVQFSHDDTRVISACNDKTVRVWNVTTSTQVLELIGHEDFCMDASWYPDNNMIVSCSRDSVRWWNANTGDELQRLATPDYDVESLATSHDGAHIACACSDATLRIWHADLKRFGNLADDDGDLNVAAFSPDAALLASSWLNHANIRLTDVDAGAELHTLRGHEEEAFVFAFSRDGRLLASGGPDRTVRLWNIATGAQTACMGGHAGTVFQLAFDPAGNRLLSGAADDSIRVWDVATGALLHRSSRPFKNLNRVSFGRDGSEVAIFDRQGTCTLWDLDTGQYTETEDNPDELSRGPGVYEIESLYPELETVVKDTFTDQIVGRYPTFLDHASPPAPCPIPGVWAMVDGTHRFGPKTARLHLLRLEGIPDTDAHSPVQSDKKMASPTGFEPASPA